MMKFHRITAWSLLLLILFVPLAGCGRAAGDGTAAGGVTPLTGSNFLLDTFVTITLYDCDRQEVLDGAFALCRSYEGVFSRTDPDSEVYALNRAGGAAVHVSAPVYEVLETALAYSRLSGGLYDVTICPVTDLWDFKADQPALPEAAALAAALDAVGYELVELGEDGAVRLLGGAQIDLGSIAKGFIADEIAGYLREQGVGSAIINLGGNVLTVGGRPDGDPFSVGIQAPFADRSEIVGAVYVSDLSVVSSGVYERFFELDGAIYHHILDPRTGYPAENDLTSVSVVCERSMDADALSTLLFLLGEQEGLELVNRLDGVEAIFIDRDGGESYSDGFAARHGYTKEP